MPLQLHRPLLVDSSTASSNQLQHIQAAAEKRLSLLAANK